MGYYFGCGNMGLGIFGGLLTLVVWVLIIIFVVWLIRHFMMRGSGPDHWKKWMPMGGDAMEALKSRYAKGEIDKKQFEEMKKDLEVK